MLMKKTRHPAYSFCASSLACPLLALAGWEQLKTDVLLHKPTDRDELWEFVYEG